MENVHQSLKKSLKYVSRQVGSLKQSMEEIRTVLEKIMQVISTCGSHSTDDTIIKIQLLLQYRLSCDDALSCLLTIDPNLLYLLGIQPQNSAKMNAERLAYVVGNEHLKQIFNISLLTSSLLRMINHCHNNQVTCSQKHKISRVQNPIVKQCLKLTAAQIKFSESLSSFNREVHKIVKRESFGPVLDHIAALKGPICQFYQAILHGLYKVKPLCLQIDKHLLHFHSQLKKDPLLLRELDPLLKKIAELLRPIHSMYHSKSNDFFRPCHQLEKRASFKRLRPFFG